MPNKNALLRLIKRCQGDPAFFVNNFCKVKHPKKGIIPFNLFSYQQKSLTEFRNHRFNIFKKCRQCFIEGTTVWTPIGPRSIESLQPGDKIYSIDNNKMVVISTVERVFNNGVSNDCCEVRSKTGHRSICTLSHRFLTNRGYIDAGDITCNDNLIEIYEPMRYGVKPDHPSDPILLGYLLTDGGCNQNNLYFANSRWKYLLEFQKHYELRFGKRLRIKKVKSGFKPDSNKNYRISLSFVDSQNWLEKYGLRGATGTDKKIPDEVFKWDNRSIALLLNRIFAGDGWYSGDHCNEVGIGQQSEFVLHQIKQLLSRFQISCKIYKSSTNSIAKLRIYGSNDFEKFVKNIDIFGKKPRKELTKGFFFNRAKGEIKSIKLIEDEYQVFDLSVPPYNNYIVDGAVVHNCGASTLTGVYALWYSMFFSQKSILIVSKRDDDAMEFLSRNVKFIYDHLPEWMKELWRVEKRNEHELLFINGSGIKSLTSSPDTLRSNSGSLIIIDESAFMQHMDAMWAGGWSVIQTGGSVVVISTTNGIGNWYWRTWSDAINGDNDFNPIDINWWDMDWTIEFVDELSNNTTRISPLDNIKDCRTEKEKEKYGPYWSPWLEDQYRQLTTKGSDKKFRQEILAEFLGTGNTVLGRTALLAIGETIRETEQAVKEKKLIPKVVGITDYVNPSTMERELLDFREQLIIWKPPFTDKSVRRVAKTTNPEDILISDRRPHMYVIGADPSSGEASDYCAVQVLDVDAHEQVAELRIKALPEIFAKMIDFIGRWYNRAFVVCERTGIGQSVCQELDHKLAYPNLYRHKRVTAALKIKYNQIGYPTSHQSKNILIKHLQDELGEDGYHIKSSRLYHELCIFVHLGKSRYGNEDGVGNSDDLVLAIALALVGIEDAIYRGNSNLIPVHSMEVSPELLDQAAIRDKIEKMAVIGGRNVLAPFNVSSEVYSGKPSKEAELAKFTTQLGGIPITKDKIPRAATQDIVSFKKHILRYFRN